MRKPLLLLSLLAFAVPAAAQSIGIEVGKVLAFDREAKVLVLTDRSVWSLAEIRAAQTDRLTAGDRVEFSYRDSGDGPTTIIEIKVSHHASETTSDEVAEGTVLAYDRRARLLILTDKSAWPLGALDPGPPPGLGVDDRVRIEYRTGEDGSVEVRDIIVIFN